MTMFGIILVLLTLAFFLLYPVVLMTAQFRHECPKLPSNYSHMPQQEEKRSQDNLTSAETESQLSREELKTRDA